MNDIKDSLYTARWAVTKGIEGDYSKLDLACDMVAQAKADIITQDVEPEREDDKPTYEVPVIQDIKAGVKTQGKYRTDSGLARGLVVHFTAGRFDKGIDSAISTLRYMGSRGLGCLVMDIHGRIYKDINQGLDEVAWHAGSSSWKGVSGISRHCIGMEICNAGMLDNKHNSWFGQNIKSDQVRYSEGKDNVKPGFYHAFTSAQEDSLMNFIKWQMDTNPEFDPDWVVGHDEIAPGRKSDPGGSLSVTMPELRASLKANN